MRIAKADLVPTEANLREQYATFTELEPASAAFCAQVNARPHRMTGRPPAQMLAEEQQRLHRLPTAPVTVAFGQTRRVGWDATISVEGARYAVPHEFIDQRVWVRWAGDQLVVTVLGPDGPREITRHERGQRGRSQTGARRTRQTTGTQAQPPTRSDHDPQLTTSAADLLRPNDDAPNGVGVKALRPLRGRAPARAWTPTPTSTHPERRRRRSRKTTGQENNWASSKRGLDRADATDKQGSRLVCWAAAESVQILPKTSRIGAIREQVGARRGRHIGVVAAAREQLELVYYGLRDHTVRRLRHHVAA